MHYHKSQHNQDNFLFFPAFRPWFILPTIQPQMPSGNLHTLLNNCACIKLPFMLGLASWMDETNSGRIERQMICYMNHLVLIKIIFVQDMNLCERT